MRLALLVSGEGTNLQGIVEARARVELSGEPWLVV
jgi:folate-dependent phosphoribosylglycinamide formyltransferase PurN